MTEPKIIVTTSWDDGHILDARLSKLLKKYNLPATFYIAPKNREFARKDLLKPAAVKKLAEDFEIGSHTMTHPVMPMLSEAEITRELRDSRKLLRDLTGQPIVSFCYPRGIYTMRMVPLVRKAGYRYARTTKGYLLGEPTDWLQAGTSLEAHRLAIPRLPQELRDVHKYAGSLPKTVAQVRWKNRAMDMFDRVRERGGVFHLWGHSWVVERENGWKDLEEVFAYISGHKDVTYCTNGDLQKEWQG